MIALSEKGITAGYVCNDESDYGRDILDGQLQFQLLFFTPESLLMKRRYRKMTCSDIYQKKIRGLVIDEAHTIKKWFVY